MDEEFDLNDLVDAVDEPNAQNQAIAEIGSDSGMPNSVSGFGVDVDDPAGNAQYLMENENPHLIIQGPGAPENIRVEGMESGVASSISRSAISEFVPEIIEFSSDIDETANNEIIPNHDHQFENYQSSFDLAIEKGYTEQAMNYVNFSTNKLESMHIKQLKELDKNQNQHELHHNDIYFSRKLVLECVRMEIGTFQKHSANIEAKKYDEILKDIENKENLVNKIMNEAGFKNKLEGHIGKTVRELKTEGIRAIESKKIHILHNLIKNHIEYLEAFETTLTEAISKLQNHSDSNLKN